MLLIYDGKNTYWAPQESLHTNHPLAIISSIIFDIKNDDMYWVDDFESPWEKFDDNNIDNDEPEKPPVDEPDDNSTTSEIGVAIIGEMNIGE